MKRRAIIRRILCTISLVAAVSCSVAARNNPSPADAPEPQWQHGWARGAVFYEIFVRSFADSDGDGVGDFNGLTSRLDYLNDGDPATTSDLGVNAIWLMPVFESPSYHGYDTTNYRKIDPEYGTAEDFQRFLQEAHKRGIRVILDFVMNHSSSEHPWFKDSASSPSSAKRNWYVWRPNNPGWSPPWGGSNPTWHPLNGAFYYGVFWSGMPDLNYRNPAVRNQMKQIATYWLNRGVDGFRLDAARHMIEDGAGQLQVDTPETHAFWKEFSRYIRGTKPSALLVGENWTDTPVIATYYGSTATVAGGNELPMNFNFPLSTAILEAIRSENAGGITAKIAEMSSVYPSGVLDAPFLTNHDNVRLATQLENDPLRLRNAAEILLTLPGTPFLYYGEEVGLQNGPTQGDESKRTPMAWDDSAGGGFTTGTPWFPFAPGYTDGNVAELKENPYSLFSIYRKLIQLRNQNEALKTGEIQVLSGSGSPQLAFLRRSATDQILVAINLSNSFVTAGPYPITAISVERLFTDQTFSDPTGSSGQWSVLLPPHGAGIWRLR